MNGSATGAALADSPQVNRRKLFEHFRETFRQDFEFVDVRDDLIKNLLTEDECRQILDETDADRQLDRLFFLLTYNEKKSLAKFIELIRNSYFWISEGIDNYLQHPRDEGLEIFETCINRSWIPNKRNILVHRCELVSDKESQCPVPTRLSDRLQQPLISNVQITQRSAAAV